MKEVISLIFAALSLIFTAGFLLTIYAPGLTEEQRGQAWKPALLAVNCAIAAIVSMRC